MGSKCYRGAKELLDHGRWRGQQHQSMPLVEACPAGFGHSARDTDSAVPLSAKDQQMEQDRTSHVCHITQNWRGRPFVSHEVIINLIASTTTRTGLKIQAELDNGHYSTGIKSATRSWLRSI